MVDSIKSQSLLCDRLQLLGDYNYIKYLQCVQGFSYPFCGIRHRKNASDKV